MDANLDYQTPIETTRSPLAELLILSIPTVAQMASYTLMQFVDRWMLAQVGDIEATAAGTAGITYFCFVGFGMGVMFVVNTLVSQAYGRGDLASTGQSLWQGIWFGLLFGLSNILLLPLAEPLFRAMGHEPRVVQMEADYLRIVALAGWAKLASMALGQFLLGLHRPTIVFVATVIGVIVNCVLNWVLIFGHWGFKPMGVVGSAWGLNAAVLCEMIVMGVAVAMPAFRVCGVNQWRLHLPTMKTLLRIGLPSGFQLICDISAWMIFMNVIVGNFGTPALSANSFAFTYMHICFMPAFGVGTAVTALVGKYIGMGRYDIARRRAHLGFAVCAIYMVLAGLSLYFYRVELIRLFSNSDEVLRIGSTIMFFVALYQIFDAMFVVYISALRGAGDTLVPAVVQAILVWSIVVGGGFIIARWSPEYGVSGPWTLATIFGGILGIYMLTRFRRGKWEAIRLQPETRGFPVV